MLQALICKIVGHKKVTYGPRAPEFAYCSRCQKHYLTYTWEDEFK